VIAVGGLAGTGKTTLATAVADALGAELLRTDVVRQELFGAGPHPAQVDGGIYSPEAREQVYEALNRRAAALHADGITVVLDATYSTAERLLQARQLASDPRSVFFAIHCVCRPEVARERISRRLAAGHDASDARPEMHEVQRSRWEEWPADVFQLRIDTEQPQPTQLGQVLAAVSAILPPSALV
jgi:predicted kinase